MAYARFMPAVPQLKRLRTARFITQQELADAARVNLRTIVAAEGGRSISFKTIRSVAKVLKVKPQDLLGPHED